MCHQIEVSKCVFANGVACNAAALGNLFNQNTCSNVPINLTYLVTNNDVFDPSVTVTNIVGESGANLLDGANVTLQPNQATTVTETIFLNVCNGANLDFKATVTARLGEGMNAAISGVTSSVTAKTPFNIAIPPAAPTAKVMVSKKLEKIQRLGDKKNSLLRHCFIRSK